MRYVRANLNLASYYARQVLLGFTKYAREVGGWEIVFPNPSPKQAVPYEVPDGYLVQIESGLACPPYNYGRRGGGKK